MCCGVPGCVATQFATQYEKSHSGEAARSADQARRELLKPGSEVARQLAKNSTVLQVRSLKSRRGVAGAENLD